MFAPKDLPSLEQFRARLEGVSDAEPTRIFAAFRLLRVAEDLAHSLEAHLQSRFGISTGRLAVLMYLSLYGPLSPSELASRCGVTRATMTGLVDGLQREGRIDRVPLEGDRRRVQVVLTEAGHAFLDHLVPKHAPALAGVTAKLSSSELTQFLELLGRIQVGFESGGPA